MNTVQQACLQIPDFDILYQKFLRKTTILGRAPSTCTNYARSLAQIALHYNQSPASLTLDQIEEYLYHIKDKSETGSDNPFKFTICALRFVLNMEGLDELKSKLPAIRKKRKLPVVLSKQEMTAMMNIPCMLKHRVLIALLYGCGLRCGEVRNVKVADVDINRAVLHVRQAKGRKDRYMPLGKLLPVILEKYIGIQKPTEWLFPGMRWNATSGERFYSDFAPQFGQRSIQWAVQRAAQLAGITKRVNVHSLRHTYATHLLEDGVNILTIKELLGHASIKNTMIYLHVAQVNNMNKCSPIDTLEGLKIIGYVQGELNFD